MPAYNHTCTVHRTVHRLSCYIYIPKYSKLFIQIVRETSFRESDCPGNVRYPSQIPDFSLTFLGLHNSLTIPGFPGLWEPWSNRAHEKPPKAKHNLGRDTST